MTREAHTELRQPEVGVAILGMGTVGTEVVRLLIENSDSFTHRVLSLIHISEPTRPY